MDQAERSDDAGTLSETLEGNELVLSWRANRPASPKVEVLRYDADRQLLRVFPKIRGATGELIPQFDKLVEIQLEVGVVRWWSRQWHSDENDQGRLEVSRLPDGFAGVYAEGVGVERGFQGVFRVIEEHTNCPIVRIVTDEPEGSDGDVFRLTAKRFATWVRKVKNNRQRGREAARRVNEAERHNILADLLGLDPVEPQFKRSAIINAMTEVVDKGYLLTEAERTALVEQVVAEAPKVARSSPLQFGRLRQDLELVSLDVLTQQFEQGLLNAPKQEAFWQAFFKANGFALQLLFAAPVTLYLEHLHVKGSNAVGQGARITDFALVNPITLSAYVVEIKTPGVELTAPRPYRGSGDAAVYPPSAEVSGAIAQVQSQVSSMREHFPAIKGDTPSLGPIDPQDVSGALIIGRLDSLSAPQLASFKRYRAGLHGVTLLGFDEVLQRLTSLHQMLSTPPATITIDSDPEPGAPVPTPSSAKTASVGSRLGAGPRKARRLTPP